MTPYSMSLNKVPYTSAFRIYFWPTYSCIHRNSIYLILGKENFSLHRDVEHFSMNKDIMPRFIRQEAETWQTMIWGGGERRGKLN